jgi:hypothetical protein
MWRLVLQQTIGLPSRIWDWLHDAACQSFQTPSQCAGNVEIFIISEPFCLIRPSSEFGTPLAITRRVIEV